MASLVQLSEVQQRFTGQATPLQSLEQVQCNVLGCDEWLPRQDLPVHLAGHFSRMAEELARLRRAVEEKDERLDDLERERACLEEEVRLVKQEGTTHFNQIRQLEQTQRQIQRQTEETADQTQRNRQNVLQFQQDLQQTQHHVDQVERNTMQIQREVGRAQQEVDQAWAALDQTQDHVEETRKELRQVKRFRVASVVVVVGLMMFLAASGGDKHLSAVLPVNVTMVDFQAHKEANDSWFSEPFYTHPHGYKVCLVVQAAGTGENSTGYVSVGIRLMRGEFDDNLDWPFHGNFTIQLLDKKGSSHTHVLDYPDRQGGRVTTEEMAGDGGNITQFVSHNDLKSYLQDNSLHFRVSRFEQNHTAVILQEIAKVQCKQQDMSFKLITGVVPVNVTIDEFQGWKESGKKWYSEPFYTHPHGYRVCLLVQAAGTGESSTGYVSVGIRLMRGEFDNNLDWPFHGNFTMQLLDKRGSSQTRVLDYPDRLGGRVTTRDMADRGWGFPRFVSHSGLKSFMQDNTLQLRVTRFEQNHTAVILHEIAEVKMRQQEMSSKLHTGVVPVSVTIAEYRRQKKVNVKRFSQPLYTHPLGYKFCLVVWAGNTNASWTSVGIRLMQGEFDDNLKWPFHGKFTIQLLDKKGTPRTTNFVLDYPDRLGSRVTGGEIAQRGWWFPHFISPEDLDFYMQANGLQIRVSRFYWNETLFLSQELGRVQATQQSMQTKQESIWFALSDVLPVDISMKEFNTYLKSGRTWYSDPFYTHVHGYKLCLRVEADGLNDGRGTHVSVYFYMMRGEFDDTLSWPFQGKLQIGVMIYFYDPPQQRNEHTLSFSDAPTTSTRRVTSGQRAGSDHGWGYPEYLPHSSLYYLDHDSLTFRITRVHR